jgi:muramoyltetrapeptide carboxypeptidase
MKPQYLKKGSVIGITCPSGYVSHERVAYATTVLQAWGFNVKLGKTVGSEHHYFSGTDNERLEDLQQMLNDTELDAILMGRGGYGMSRIIDSIDFTAFRQKPKWICGFSDIVVLLNHLQSQYDICSFHSPMCGAFKPGTENTDHVKSLYAALTGESLYYHTPRHPFNRIRLCGWHAYGWQPGHSCTPYRFCI